MLEARASTLMKMSGTPSETQWAARMARGERAAVEQFLDAFGPRVHRLARRYARDGSDAEDLTQEIFVALFRSAGSFRGEASLATWVYRVALNHALRHHDRWQRESNLNEPHTGDEPIEIADVGADPARYAARGELNREVYGALDGLAEGQREVVILHELHGLTYSECADVLKIPIGTVKSRLFNAFRHLRTSLGPYVLGDDTAIAVRATQSTSTPAAYGETP